jgi:hypothetical protein
MLIQIVLFFMASDSWNPRDESDKTPCSVVGYKIGSVEYFVATDRHDLTADQSQQYINQVEN